MQLFVGECRRLVYQQDSGQHNRQHSGESNHGRILSAADARNKTSANLNWPSNDGAPNTGMKCAFGEDPTCVRFAFRSASTATCLFPTISRSLGSSRLLQGGNASTDLASLPWRIQPSSLARPLTSLLFPGRTERGVIVHLRLAPRIDAHGSALRFDSRCRPR